MRTLADGGTHDPNGAHTGAGPKPARRRGGAPPASAPQVRRQVSWLTGLVVRVAFPESSSGVSDAEHPSTVAGAATVRRRIPFSPRKRGDRLPELVGCGPGPVNAAA